MIRWLCYALVLANGLLFWMASQTPVPEQKTLSQANLPRVETLQLLGETSQPRAPETTEDPPVTDCFVLSGFSSPEEARRWREGQSLAEEQARSRSVTVALPPYYWVLVPPLDSRQAAVSRLAEIQKQGVESFVISEGPQQWGISLGLFETRDKAEALLASRRRGGIKEAVLQQRPRSRVLYALEGAESLQSAARNRQLKPNGLALSLRACEGVAKVDKSP